MIPMPDEHTLLPASKPVSASQPVRRVAVIGVHGVAHHEPGATANDMADLLLSLPPFDPTEAHRSCAERPQRQFEHFETVGIQVPLQPVCVKEEEKVRPQFNKFVRWFQEGSARFARGITGLKLGEERGRTGRRWSSKLLQDYYGGADGNAYISIRLSSRRRTDSADVHIYEMFWADLARPTNSLISFFLAFFQLILHLPSLSRLAIDTRPDADWSWKTFQFLHRYASRVLQIALPLAEVVLLIVLSAAIPAVTKVQNLRLLSAIVGGVLLAVIGFLLMNGSRTPVFAGKLPWLILSFVPALAFTTLVFALVKKNVWNEVFLLVIAIWASGAALVWWALNAYEDMRPGVRLIGWLCYLAALFRLGEFGFRAWGWNHDASFWIQEASFWTVQWLLVMLRVSWIILAILAILSSLLGAFAWRRAFAGPERAKARAAVRTSRFALALPSFLFVFVTSFIWAGLFSIAQKINDPFFAQSVIRNEAPHPHWRRLNNIDLFPNLSIVEGFPPDCEDKKPFCAEPNKESCSCAKETKPDYLKGVLAWSVGYGSYLAVVITFAGLIILVWWALPSVLTEKFPARRPYAPGKTEPPRSSTNRESAWMGSWTSRGLDSISVVTLLTWVAIFLIPLGFMYVGPPHLSLAVREHSRHVTKLLVCRVIAVAGTAAVLTAVVRYSSEILRVILDVDTYLRTGPIEATPRAKIFERYVSLLRHIAQYRGADGHGYDQVVIVAHSLGALISGDLLNLLQHQKNDPELQQLGYGPGQAAEKIPIRLFTMGNPLRQLLNRFFPYLYDWVRESPDNGAKQLDPPLPKPPGNLSGPSGSTLLPDPVDLGVERWVNAYRSGDYVGRSLWLDEWYRRTDTRDEDGAYPEPLKKIADATGNRVEFCIGAGAHTHYWDDTAPDIAEELNNLI
jgi:hypothetical protein